MYERLHKGQVSPVFRMFLHALRLEFKFDHKFRNRVASQYKGGLVLETENPFEFLVEQLGAIPKGVASAAPEGDETLDKNYEYPSIVNKRRTENIAATTP